jgi:S1-C subfamily serine protease
MMALAAAVPGSAAEPPTIGEIFLMVDQAVVEITTVQQVVADQGPARRVAAGSLGSGFLISSDGRIMTAAHVVQVADKITVRFVTGDEVAARVLASDPSADVALIQAESVPAGVKPALLGNSDEAAVGDQVLVIGAPYGIAHTLTVGHVSARRAPNHLFGGFEKVELLQTDAAINQGNSGGPMFNMKGEVIGVVSHIFSTSGGFQGLGFVVTSNLAMKVLIDDPTGWTGLHGVVIDGPVAAALNVPQSAGILVDAVAAGSPASALGLLAGDLKANIAGTELTLGGDIILAVHGIRVGEPDFQNKVRARRETLGPADQFEVTVLRGGNVIKLSKPVSVLFSK